MQDRDTGLILIRIRPEGERHFSASPADIEDTGEFRRRAFWEGFHVRASKALPSNQGYSGHGGRATGMEHGVAGSSGTLPSNQAYGQSYEAARNSMEQHERAVSAEALPSIEAYETRLRKQLGAALLAQIEEYAGASRKAALSKVRLHVVGIDYGSLDLNLGVSGLKQLSEFFDGHFDLFAMFLTAYLPRAFWSLYPEFEPQILDCDVDASADVKQAFQPGTTDSDNGTTLSRTVAKAKWFWAGANTTLLVPVLLALLVTYVVFEATGKERADLLAGIKVRQEQLAKREQTLAERERSRIDSLEKQEAMLIDRLVTVTSAMPCSGCGAVPVCACQCKKSGDKPRPAPPPALPCAAKTDAK